MGYIGERIVAIVAVKLIRILCAAVIKFRPEFNGRQRVVQYVCYQVHIKVAIFIVIKKVGLRVHGGICQTIGCCFFFKDGDAVFIEPFVDV